MPRHNYSLLIERLVMLLRAGDKRMTYKVIKYWDTYPDGTWKDKIKTFEEAKEIAKKADLDYYNKGKRGYDFYVFDENGVKLN